MDPEIELLCTQFFSHIFILTTVPHILFACVVAPCPISSVKDEWNPSPELCITKLTGSIYATVLPSDSKLICMCFCCIFFL